MVASGTWVARFHVYGGRRRKTGAQGAAAFCYPGFLSKFAGHLWAFQWNTNDSISRRRLCCKTRQFRNFIGSIACIIKNINLELTEGENCFVVSDGDDDQADGNGCLM